MHSSRGYYFFSLRIFIRRKKETKKEQLSKTQHFALASYLLCRALSIIIPFQALTKRLACPELLQKNQKKGECEKASRGSKHKGDNRSNIKVIIDLSGQFSLIFFPWVLAFTNHFMIIKILNTS